MVMTDSTESLRSAVAQSLGLMGTELFFWEGGAKAAEQKCESMGGHLATISSRGEDVFLFGYMRSCNIDYATFGFTDSAKEGTWCWVTGEPVAYVNWAPEEPNDLTDDEDWAEFYSDVYPDGTWNDSGNFDDGDTYICEWDYVE